MNKKSRIIVLLLFLIGTNTLLGIKFGKFDTNNEQKDEYGQINPYSSNGNFIRVIVFFNQTSFNSTVTNSFENFYGGTINKQWNNTFISSSGFCGILYAPNKSLFANDFPDASVEIDGIIETQMNYATLQTQALNSSWFFNGFKGDINSSIAVLDTGINGNHEYFSNGYTPNNMNGTIIGWENIISPGGLISDDNGHGTYIASIIAGTGINSSENPTKVNLYGNYSHLDISREYTTSSNYTLKIFSFNASKVNSTIMLNSTYDVQVSGIDKFWFELFHNSNLVNYSYNNETKKYFQINHTVTQNNEGVYDLYIKYKKQSMAIPIFSFNASVSFYPESYIQNYSSSTGIANNTKIVAYKIINQSGRGYVSDLIDALGSVVLNKSKYHIVSVCLSIGTSNNNISVIINKVIDDVIKNGTMVVIAAGNSGLENSDPLNKLALNKRAIVVGATNDMDQVTSYSSGGIAIEDGEITSKNLGGGRIKPDIVAPGGSKVSGHRTIMGGDAFSNQSTSGFGTSISTAIVAAAINILIEAGWGKWNSWKDNNLVEMNNIIKSTLLMTASETNLPREDDPLTTEINEGLSKYSPTRYLESNSDGLKDPHEGYGRLNIQAAIDALIKSMDLNVSYSDNLSSSQDNPLGKHVFARRVFLNASTTYNFSITGVDSNADFDLYLYSNESDQYGEPILLASSRKSYFDYDYFYFIPKKNQTECIFTVKAIQGSSNFSIKFKNVSNIYSPELKSPVITYYLNYNKNTTIMSLTEYENGESPPKNYTIDKYIFFIEYSDNDTSNAPPQEIYVSIIESGKNISLYIQEPTQDLDFREGVIYRTDEIEFRHPGNYSYFFFTSDGKNSPRFPLNYNYSIEVELPTDSISIPCSYDFKNGMPTKWTKKGTGWDILNQSNVNDNRSSLHANSWKSIYFGTEHSTPSIYSYQTDSTHPEYPHGNLTTPIFNLTQLDENFKPILRIGIRVSINSEDYIRLEATKNWTGWEQLKEYGGSNGQEQDWFMEEINLSDYKDNFVQFRFRSFIDDEVDLTNNRGFILDYFNIANYTINQYTPTINTENTVEKIYPNKAFKYQIFRFSCQYIDEDNNYPDYVYLEIEDPDPNGDGKLKNYTMVNIFGDWNVTSLDNGILFRRSFIIGDISNRSFRFHISDGKYINNTEWFNKDNSEIELINPVVMENNYIKKGKLIGYEFSCNDLDEFYITGYPMPEEYNAWLYKGNTWHSINYSDVGFVLHAGQGDFDSDELGYGDNWNAHLITKPILGGDEYPLYLDYDFEISIENEFGVSESNLDRFIVSISTNYGEDWTELISYDYTYEFPAAHETIDISSYSNKIIMLRFTLHSNSEGSQLGQGWILYNITIGYDETTDFIPPIIEILNPSDHDTVDSITIIEAKISDDIELDLSRIKIYINDKLIENDGEKIKFDPTTGILTYEWDTTQYSDGIYDVNIIIFDMDGNQAQAEIDIIVDNKLHNLLIWTPWLIIMAVITITGIIIHKRLKKKGITSITDLRDYYWAKKTTVAYKDKDKIRKVISSLNQEEELQRPFTLYCKFCDSWFSSDRFDTHCPTCEKDYIYVAYYCLICRKWKFKDTPKDNYFCKKCSPTVKRKERKLRKKHGLKKKGIDENKIIKLIRLKREEVEEILLQKRKILREFVYDKKEKGFSILD